MTFGQRIRSVLFGIFMIVCVIIFMIAGTDSYEMIIWIYGVMLLCNGISRIHYYFSLARYMVDGKIMLYIGVILVDFGMFTFSLTNIPVIYVVIYLMGIHAFTGIVDILRALETKKYGGGSWKLNFSYGLANIIMAALCVMLIRTMPMIVIVVYCLGLTYSAIVKIISGFQRTAIVYIQ